ncbi:MAG: MarR family winged helix-turn-helix transcriptional regulator [Mycobacteriales bacterium]
MADLGPRDIVDRIVEQWAGERPDLDTRAMATIGRVQRVARYLDREIERELARFGVNLNEFNVLAALRRSGAPYQLAPAELSRMLLLTSGGLTKRIDRLHHAGLVTRVPDPEDGRGLLVGLTERGNGLLTEAMTAHIQNENKALAALTPEESDQLAALLRTLLLSYGDGSQHHRDRNYRLERRRSEAPHANSPD